MPVFKDKNGNEWQIDVTVDVIRRVKSEAGVMLTETINTDGKLLAKLMGDDPSLLTDVLWAIIRPVAEAKQYTPDKLAAALAGDRLREASDALIGATADFFPYPAQREMLLAFAAKTREITTALMGKITEKINEPEKPEPQNDSQATTPGA